MKQRLLFIVESGTDVRMVEGLAEHFQLSILARKIEGGVEISRRTSAEFDLSLGPGSRTRFGAFIFFELLRRQPETDVVLVQGYSLAALAANIARQITGLPTIMLICSPIEAYYRCRLTHPMGAPYRAHEASTIDWLARFNALTGDTYVVLSEYLGSVVSKHGGKHLHRIPIYGVDTAIFHPPAKSKRELKSELGLPTEGTLIFFSSRVAPEKDSATLLKAVRRLLDAGEDLWLLHRSGGYYQFLADAEKFGVRDRVIATDAVHPHGGLALDYQACDVCVQASREEGLGFSPLEGLACETPVIATGVGGLKETIRDGETGWTYPVGDDVALARRLKEVIADPVEGLRRARNGRKMVEERFDRAVAFRMFSELTENLAGKPPKISGNRQKNDRPKQSLAIESNRSESAQISNLGDAFRSGIRLLGLRRAKHNASVMPVRTVFAIPPRACAPKPQAGEVTSEQPRTSCPLNIAIAIHASRDQQTAVYENTKDRQNYLEDLGHRCTILAPEDFPILQRIDARFLPLFYPIALAWWLAKHKEVDVALFHSYAGSAVTFLQRWLGAFAELRTAIVFHGLEPIYYERLKRHAESSGRPLSWRYRLVHGFPIRRILRSSTRKADVLSA